MANIEGTESGAFSLGASYDEPMTANARGGTELMRERIFARLPQELLNKFNIISSRVRYVDPVKPNVLWCHDIHSDPEAKHLSSPISRNQFKKIVYVSHWQKDMYQTFLLVPPSQGIVLKNAIEPFPERTKEDGIIRLIYNTTPHRGLDLLVSAFADICQYFDNFIHLDVYSSFSAYGELWKERDKPYEKVFEFCRNHPRITYHGYQPYDVVKEALLNAHIQVLPSIFPETSCLSVIDAMSARCDVVCSDLAALPETTGGLATVYPYNEDVHKHVEILKENLISVIRKYDSEESMFRREFAKVYADKMYNIDTRALEWQKLLYKILGEQK